MDHKDISRRDVLRYGAAIGAATACAGCIPGGSRKADVVAEPQAGTLLLSEAESAGLTEPDSSLLVSVEGEREKILLIHTGGVLHAVSSRCTHLGCDVLYDRDAAMIVCPCHKSQYALDGSNLTGPAKQPLRRYTAIRRQGRVVVTL